MKSFKQFIKESEGPTAPLVYKDWLIEISDHFFTRYEERSGFSGESHIIRLLKRAVDKIDLKHLDRLPSNVFIKYRHGGKGCAFTAFAEWKGNNKIRQHMHYELSDDVKKGIVGVTALGCRDRGFPEPNRKNREIVIMVRENDEMRDRKVRPVEDILEMYAKLKGMDKFAVRSIDNNYYIYDHGEVTKILKENRGLINEDILITEEGEDEWCLFEFENYFEDDEDPLVIEIDEDED